MKYLLDVNVLVEPNSRRWIKPFLEPFSFLINGTPEN